MGGAAGQSSRFCTYSGDVGPLRVRQATGTDYDAICAIELVSFPRTAEHIFARDHRAALLMNPTTPRNPFRIAVAEQDSQVVGFVVTRPYTFATVPVQTSSSDFLLERIAVAPDLRRGGVGLTLITELERQLRQVHQDIIVAHVPVGQAEFYRRAGWAVLAQRRGLAWLPFLSHLRADGPISGSGYDCFAYLVLRPRALRTVFAFEQRTTQPLADAADVLTELIDRGEIDRRDLDDFTTALLPGGPLRHGH